MNSKKALKTVFPYFWKRHNTTAKVLVMSSFVLLIVAKMLAAYVPVIFQRTIDSLNGTTQVAVSVFSLIVMYGVAQVLSRGLNDVREVLFARVLYRSIRMLALDVFNHLHNLSLRFHLDRKTGAVTRYIEQGVKALERLIQFSTYGLLPTIVEILFVWSVILILFPIHFFVIIFCTISAYVYCTYVITNYRTRVLREHNDVEAYSTHRAVDGLLNYETVKYFGNEENESNLYDNTLVDFEKTSVRLRESLAMLNIVQGIIASLGVATCLYYAAVGVMDKSLSLGQYVMIHTYLMQMYIPLGNLGFMYREIKEAMLRLSTMLEVLAAEPDIKDSDDPKQIEKNSVIEIEFKKVSFSYNPERQILQDVSFKVQEGETIALVGESGAGKSTITRLLFRFYDVTGGGVYINNVNIQELAQKDVRQIMAVVPQDTVLFNDTLGYNLRYGNINATEEQLHAAIKGARLTSFIKKLPEGLNTVVGERGLKLSGGEKQRVAIARALLKNPKVFIFDEATSSLDSTTEKEIQKNLTEISKGKTTLIIAHRLSTIVHADQILVLDKGCVVESGTHTQLLKKNMLYAKMWKQQTEEENKKLAMAKTQLPE